MMGTGSSVPSVQEGAVVFAGVYALLVGIVMIGQWAFS
jgi:hypothetical protein